MAYKLKNITNTLSKRHHYFDRELVIEYGGKGFRSKTFTINSGDEVIADFDNLPASVRKLLLQGYLHASKMENEEYARIILEREKKEYEAKEKLMGEVKPKEKSPYRNTLEKNIAKSQVKKTTRKKATTKKTEEKVGE